MTNAVLLDMTNLAAMLYRPGEGLAYLEQLGVDPAPRLSEAEETRLRDAASGPVDPPGETDSAQYASLADTITGSSRRITLVAELSPRRSMVAFVAGETAASFGFSEQEIVASELDLAQLKGILSESVSEAMTQGVHWTVARWEGTQRVLALGSDGTEMLITGEDHELVEDASVAMSLSDLSDLIVDERT